MEEKNDRDPANEQSIKQALVNSLESLLEEISNNENARYALAKFYRMIFRWLGIWAAVISVLVSGSLFCLIQSQANENTKIVLAIISTVGAIISGIQVFMQPQNLAEINRSCGYELLCLRKKLQPIIDGKDMYSCSELNKHLIEISENYAKASKGVPEIPAGVWKKYCQLPK